MELFLVGSMPSDWTELYRPSTLDEVYGNPKAVSELREWAERWESGNPDKKAAVLMGPPGIGKTSAALALANEFDWGVVEMNASDQRNAEAIRSIALRGALFDTFTEEGEFLSSKKGFRKLIILDEADNIFGREDRGGIPAISELVRSTRQPVLLIVNDFYELKRRSSAIKSNSKQIRFNRIKPTTVKKVLSEVCMSENLKASDRTLQLIADNSEGDMRAALRDLQSLAAGRKEIAEMDAGVLDNRMVSKGTQDLMREIFKGSDPGKARRTAWDVDEAPDHLMLWVDENLPAEYRDPRELRDGYEMLSRADLFMGRTRRRQYYGLWSYASDLMTFGVASVKRGKHQGFTRFRFPSYLIKMSRSKGRRGTMNSLSRKLGAYFHTSGSRAREDILPHLCRLFQGDRDLRVWLTLKLGLEQGEAAFMLGEKVDSNPVKHLMAEVDRLREAGSDEASLEGLGATSEEARGGKVDGEKEARSQRSLFEY
ncbi:MAG: replication factor C large subunit [Methanomassiliicoccales archaeon]